MTKNKLKTINLIILMVSLVCFIIFLILSNNWKDNIIFWIFIPLIVLSTLITIKEYSKEIRIEDFCLTKENMSKILKLYWEKEKSEIFHSIFDIGVFILIAFILEYGYFCTPFIIYIIIHLFVKAINYYEKNRIKA